MGNWIRKVNHKDVNYAQNREIEDQKILQYVIDNIEKLSNDGWRDLISICKEEKKRRDEIASKD